MKVFVALSIIILGSFCSAQTESKSLIGRWECISDLKNIQPEIIFVNDSSLILRNNSRVYFQEMKYIAYYDQRTFLIKYRLNHFLKTTRSCLVNLNDDNTIIIEIPSGIEKPYFIGAKKPLTYKKVPQDINEVIKQRDTKDLMGVWTNMFKKKLNASIEFINHNTALFQQNGQTYFQTRYEAEFTPTTVSISFYRNGENILQVTGHFSSDSTIITKRIGQKILSSKALFKRQSKTINY